MECPAAELLIEINSVRLLDSVLFGTSSHARTASRRLRGRVHGGPLLDAVGRNCKKGTTSEHKAQTPHECMANGVDVGRLRVRNVT